jgi:hypothetical protein
MPTVAIYATADGWAAELAVMQLIRRGVWSVRVRRQEAANATIERPYQIRVQEADVERATLILERFRGRGTLSARRS